MGECTGASDHQIPTCRAHTQLPEVISMQINLGIDMSGTLQHADFCDEYEADDGDTWGLTIISQLA